MKRFNALLGLALAILLSACNSSKTPADVAETFWQAMLEGDSKTATRHSTLVSEAAFDGFSQDWSGASFTLGRTIIDETTSEVVIRFTNLPDANNTTRQTTTYLVKQQDQWLVDYYATQDAFNNLPMVDRLIGTFSGLSERLKSELSQHSRDAARELDRIGEELARQAKELNQQLEPAVEDYAEQLQDALDDLSDSLREALEKRAEASPEDKRILNETISQLEQQSERLKQFSLVAMAEATHALAEAQLQLAKLSEDFAGRQEGWETQFEEIRRKLNNFLEGLGEPES